MDEKRPFVPGYEIVHTIELGGNEIILSKTDDAVKQYAVCDAVLNNLSGKKKISNFSDVVDYVAAMKEFSQRISRQVRILEAERKLRGIPLQAFTAADCNTAENVNIKGCAVVINADALPPEYRSIDYQLALCTGGYGADSGSNVGTVFCQNIISGTVETYSREDIVGMIPDENLPFWAKDSLDALRQLAEEKSKLAAAPMDKEQFWLIIDSAKETAGGWKGMLEPLVDTLSLLDEPDIIRWKQIFDEYQGLADKEKLWAAAMLMNGGCSDDGFMDFRGWLTAQGKEVFLKALENPDSLVEVEAVHKLAREAAGLEYMPDKGFENWAYFEHIIYSASYAYKKMFGHDADIYEALEVVPLSEKEKADIAGEVKYATDIDTDIWRESGHWAIFKDCVSKLLPNLHKIFTDPDALAVSAETVKPEQGNRAPAGKESVLEQIEQDKRSKKSADKQPQGKKQQKTKKTEPEH